MLKPRVIMLKSQGTKGRQHHASSCSSRASSCSSHTSSCSSRTSSCSSHKEQRGDSTTRHHAHAGNRQATAHKEQTQRADAARKRSMQAQLRLATTQSNENDAISCLDHGTATLQKCNAATLNARTFHALVAVPQSPCILTYSHPSKSWHHHIDCTYLPRPGSCPTVALFSHIQPPFKITASPH